MNGTAISEVAVTIYVGVGSVVGNETWPLEVSQVSDQLRLIEDQGPAVSWDIVVQALQGVDSLLLTLDLRYRRLPKMRSFFSSEESRRWR